MSIFVTKTELNSEYKSTINLIQGGRPSDEWSKKSNGRANCPNQPIRMRQRPDVETFVTAVNQNTEEAWNKD